MPDDNIDDLDELDGSTLRKKLEKALGENRKLSEENASFRAKDVISSKGFSLVKAEDLAGVHPDRIEEHAASLQEKRLGERQDLARDLLVRQGYEGSDLEEALESLMAGEGPVAQAPREPEPAEAFDRVRAVDRQAATPVSGIDAGKLHGLQAIEAGLAANTRKPRRF